MTAVDHVRHEARGRRREIRDRGAADREDDPGEMVALDLPPHSCRSASTGSTREARLAGA
jgi:hypothetical protein